MKLGVLDSGLGGLVIAKAIRDHLPDLDMLYFGDTLHLPYGNRSAEAIYNYSKNAVEYLFEQGCVLIIVACNTISASALRRLQQEYLPSSPYFDRRILGVVVPTLECAIDAGYEKLGVIATNYTVSSHVFEEELHKLNPDIQITQQNTPLLVPLIENNGEEWIEPVLKRYLSTFGDKDIEALILGCTHYAFLKNQVSKIIGENVRILSQDEIIPDKLSDYLKRHPEIAERVARKEKTDFQVSDITDGYINAARKIYGQDIKVRKVDFCSTSQKYIGTT